MLNIQKNEGAIDRLLRALAAVLLFIGAFFWVGWIWSIVLVFLGIIALLTSVTGFCALYLPLKINTAKSNVQPNRVLLGAIIFVIFVTAIGGSYGSIFFTSKFFLEDYHQMNQSYKQTLFETGQGKRTESILNYEKLLVEHKRFMEIYRDYRPYALRRDALFLSNVIEASTILASVDSDVRSGDLVVAHKTLEDVRPIYQDLLKRNGFTMLAVYLVDFHDSMERVLEPAEAKNAERVLSEYIQADVSFALVEALLNDEEIQAIRANLEALKKAAEAHQVDALPDLGSKLKSSFIKVYLKRG